VVQFKFNAFKFLNKDGSEQLQCQTPRAEQTVAHPSATGAALQEPGEKFILIKAK
jgi:hypothetical protein